jgi:hypothetical protein
MIKRIRRIWKSLLADYYYWQKERFFKRHTGMSNEEMKKWLEERRNDWDKLYKEYKNSL